MTEHVVIMFAYHYPPENTIGADRPFRFAKYLARLGYTCRVFTAAEQAGRNDPGTEHVPDPFLTRPRASASWQLERALRKLFVPGDMGMQWSYYASRAARACMRMHPGARLTLFSTYPPLGSHLAAWGLAQRENLPWIADFRDPFPNEQSDQSGHPMRLRVYRRLERGIARRADAIVANTDTAMYQWQEKFPFLSGKAHAIWNGFDPEERVTALPAPSGAGYVLSHTGELYGGRNATPVLESIGRLIAAGRAPRSGVLVRLVGAAEPNALPGQEFLARARSEGWLELVNELLPKAEALRIAQSSHGLLLLQPHTSTQAPGKLFEYLQIGRPVLAFVQPDSPTERLLARSGVPYRCVYPGCTPEVTDGVVASFFALPSTPVAPSAWFEEQFNAESQTRVLDSLIRLGQSKGTSPEHATGDRVKQVGFSG